jgi:hypothetical protein
MRRRHCETNHPNGKKNEKVVARQKIPCDHNATYGDSQNRRLCHLKGLGMDLMPIGFSVCPGGSL